MQSQTCNNNDFAIDIVSPVTPIVLSEYGGQGCAEIEVCIDFFYLCSVKPSQNLLTGFRFPIGAFEITDLGDFTDLSVDPDFPGFMLLRDESNFATNDLKNYCFTARPTAYGANEINSFVIFQETTPNPNGNGKPLTWFGDGETLATGNLSALIANGTMPSPNNACNPTETQNWFVEGDLIIDVDYCLMGKNVRSEVKMAHGARIVVSSGRTFTIDNANFSPCANKLWNKIEVRPGAKLIITNSTITGGDVSIDAGFLSTISMDGVDFIDNRTGIWAHDGPVRVLAFNNNSFSIPTALDLTAAIKLDDVLNVDFVGTGNSISQYNKGVSSENSNFTLSGFNIFETNTAIEAEGTEGAKNMLIENNIITNGSTGIASVEMNATIRNNIISEVDQGFFGRRRGRAYFNENSISANYQAIGADHIYHLQVTNNSLLESTNLFNSPNNVNTIRADSDGVTFVRVENNQKIKSSNGADNTIWIRNAGAFRARNNTVQNDFEEGDGINMTAVNNISLYCNGITGTGVSSRGIFNADSRGSIICNQTNLNGTGVEFSGFPGNVAFKGNNMLGNPNTGLLINGGGTAIGQQIHHGNTWNGSDATHAGNNFFDSRFTVHTNQPPFHPPLNVPQGSGSDWFDVIEDDYFECADPDCGGGIPDLPEPPVVVWDCEEEYTQLEMSIADGSLNDFETREGVWWNAQKQLLRKIRIPCVGEPPVMPPEVEVFDEAHEESDLGKLLNVQIGIEKLGLFDSPEWQQMNATEQSLNNEVDNWKNISNQLDNENLTMAERNALLDQQTIVLDNIQQLQNQLTAARQSYKGLVYQTAAQLLSQNNAINPTSLQAQNENTVNTIYLQTLAVDNEDFTEAQLTNLYAVASQCPQDGGHGVHRARALYAYTHPEVYFDDDGCESSGENLRRSGKIDVPSLAVAPNPTDGLVMIGFDNMDFEATIFVTNLIGQTLVESKKEENQSNVSLDCASLKPGIYYIQVWKGEELIETQKLSILK